jgi:DNA-binding response OmpR family regulator
MRASILLIEGKRSDYPTFSYGLQKKGYEVELVSTGSLAVARLSEAYPDLAVVNAASLRTNGRRICQTLRKELDGLPIVLITDQPSASLAGFEADVVLSLPFTIQKLINRIKPLLPAEEKNQLHVGPIRLDLEQHRVRCMGKNSKLTPRMITLLKLLMEKKGEVIERDVLFKHVWDTEYTADTRTLDVHISWLREALEADPRHPRFLKTVRGVGYRLDV